MALPNTFSVSLDDYQNQRLAHWASALAIPSFRATKADVMRMAFDMLDTVLSHQTTLAGSYRFVSDTGEIGEVLVPPKPLKGKNFKE